MAQNIPSPRLKVVKSTGEERVVTLDIQRFTIGRSGENSLQTNDASVSRYHAEILQQNGQFVLVDKDSKCGTYINGQRIHNQVLKHQDRIQLGNETQLIFLTHEDATTQAPAHYESSSVLLSLHGLGGADLRNVSRLLETARAFSSGSLELGEVLDLVLDTAIEVTSAERAFVVLKDADGQPRFQRARGKDKQPLPEEAFQISRTVLKQVMDSGERVLLSDVQGPKNFAASESILNLELRTIFCLPLRRFEILDSSMAGDKTQEIIGALYLDSKKATEIFSKISQGILDSLAADATQVIENARLLKEAKEKERLEMELATAHEIQSILLPRIGGQYMYFEACAQNIPSRHISGDYYDLIRFPDGNHGFVIADVSGKGVSAAILCSMVQGILYAEALREGSLAECLSRVNKYLVQRTRSNRFVTLFIGVLDPAGEFRFINAGHNAPIVVHGDGSIEELEGTSVILGAFDFAIYQEQMFNLREGDLICLYTDGVTEAKDRSGNLLGEDRLRQILSTSYDDSPQHIVEKIFNVVREHSSGVPQSDDVSVFVLRYKVSGPIADTVH